MLELTKQYHIKYDNAVEDAFYVGDKETGKYRKFPQNKEGLYAFSFNDKYKKALKQNQDGKCLVETVAKNISHYSNNQQQWA